MNNKIIKELFTIDNPQKIINSEIARLKCCQSAHWPNKLTYGDKILITIPKDGVIKNRVQSITVEQDEIFAFDSVFYKNNIPMVDVALYQYYDAHENQKNIL